MDTRVAVAIEGVGEERLVWLFAEFVADPNIMASVTFPGGILGTYGEWAYTEPVPK